MEMWEELAAFHERIQSARLTNLSAADLREYGQLYRQAASDLAYMTTYYPSSERTAYLNRLVAVGHESIYRNRAPVWAGVMIFFLVTFPQTIRRNYRYFLFATGLFLGTGLLSFFMARNDEAYVYLAASPEMVAMVKAGIMWTDAIEEESQLGVSGAIMTNNIWVSILAFAYSAGLGILTLYIVLTNGIMLGSVAALCHNYPVGDPIAPRFWAFVLPHGTIELTVIFIAAAAGFILADSLIHPGPYPRRQSFRLRSVEALHLLLGSIPFLILAGFIEGFVSPSSSIPQTFKYIFGIVMGLGFYSYLFVLDLAKTGWGKRLIKLGQGKTEFQET